MTTEENENLAEETATTEAEVEVEETVELTEDQQRIKALESKLSQVNNESKKRKEKLRQLETEREAERKQLLEKQGKYQELYEELAEKTKDYEELVNFKSSYLESQEQAVSEKLKLLTTDQRDEFDLIADNLPIDKQIKWIDLKLNAKKTVNLDTDSSVRGGGGLAYANIKTRSQLLALGSEKMHEFKQKQPDSYWRAMKNNS